MSNLYVGREISNDDMVWDNGQKGLTIPLTSIIEGNGPYKITFEGPAGIHIREGKDYKND